MLAKQPELILPHRPGPRARRASEHAEPQSDMNGNLEPRAAELAREHSLRRTATMLPGIPIAGLSTPVARLVRRVAIWHTFAQENSDFFAIRRVWMMSDL